MRRASLEDSTKINSIRFSQDFRLFTASMDSGIRIYNATDLKEYMRLNLKQVGSVGNCEMLYNTNLIAYIGGGTRPQLGDDFIVHYDTNTFHWPVRTRFASKVLAFRRRSDLLVVALRDRIHMLVYPKLEVILTQLTYPNDKGIVEISPLNVEKQILVYQGHKVGCVSILNITHTDTKVTNSPTTIKCSENDVCCIALNPSATKMATASTYGTLIRVWDTTTKSLLAELRRGSDQATIYCINFSPASDYLCCSSDKGTIHIFALANPSLNKRLPIRSKIFGQYVAESQWALVNFTVQPDVFCICAFTETNAVIALCGNGTYHKYVFNTEGSIHRDVYDVFLDLCNDNDFWFDF